MVAITLWPSDPFPVVMVTNGEVRAIHNKAMFGIIRSAVIVESSQELHVVASLAFYGRDDAGLVWYVFKLVASSDDHGFHRMRE